jgi:hypothetical protein
MLEGTRTDEPVRLKAHSGHVEQFLLRQQPKLAPDSDGFQVYALLVYLLLTLFVAQRLSSSGPRAKHEVCWRFITT